MKILNVTPEEFSELMNLTKECVNDFGEFNEANFAFRMEKYFQVRLHTGPYEVRVRYDVPHIPFYSLGIERIESGGGTSC